MKNLKKKLCLLAAFMLIFNTACVDDDFVPPAVTTAATTTTEKAQQAQDDPTVESGPEESARDNFTKPTVEYESVFSEDFESGESNFSGRDKETVAVVEGGYESDNCLSTSGRTATWNGPIINITDFVEPGVSYDFSAMVKYEGIPDSTVVNITVEQNGKSYIQCGSVSLKNGEWQEAKATISVPEDTDTLKLYLEGQYSATAAEEDLFDIYLDDVEILSAVIKNLSDLPSLYEKHKDYFLMGTCISASQLKDPAYTDILTKQFNSMTMENEMKPDAVLDKNACQDDPERYNLEPAIHFRNLDVGLEYAKENGLLIRYHTLIWHSQTPDWFFKENYSGLENAPLASKEVMTARMESFIKQVMTYINDNYPGIVYAYDVVNEAIAPSDGEEGGYRSKDSLWYQIMGPEFVELAFTYAREYAEPGAKLFYNDYQTYDSSKKYYIYDMLAVLADKGIIDGMGMQCHMTMGDPTTIQFQEAIEKYASLGLEVQITELDIELEDNSEEEFAKLGVRYKKLMNTMRSIVDKGKANITSVSVWGISDKGSWLNKDNVRRYPLLFDDYLVPKDAFWGFYLDESIPNF